VTLYVVPPCRTASAGTLELTREGREFNERQAAQLGAQTRAERKS
jgi:hypothetical protein